MNGLFITGTDTEVGKTYVTALLTRQLQQQGHQVSARKPVASGCAQHCQDGEQLALACHEPLDDVCPFRFDPAISPARAIVQANSPLRLAQLLACCHPAAGKDRLLVEGAGGFLSPLTPDALNADLAQALQLPVLLVAANRLGCLNHTLLTLEAIQSRGLTCAAILINDQNPQQADPDNIYDLQHLVHQSGSKLLHLPHGARQLGGALNQIMNIA